MRTEILKHTFLFRAYREFKLLFVVAIVFMVGTLWFSLKSREEFPFLLFGMYSLKEEVQEEYIAYSIVVDGSEIVYKYMNDAQRELVVTSLSNSISSNKATEHYFKWLSNYIAPGKSLEIYKLTCLYSQEGAPLIKKRELIYPYE